jgi:ArsR family transcriptional regulator
VLAETARVLRPGGVAIVIDLASHDRQDLTARLAHRHPGFSETRMQQLLRDAGMAAEPPASVPGPLIINLWSAMTYAATTAAAMQETPTLMSAL